MFHLKKQLLIVLGCCLFSFSAFSQWANVENVLKNIKAPVFRNKTYSVLNYGAVADNQTNCKPAFDKAINLCSNEGGGKVIVPKGNYFMAGPIVLKSHVNLVLEEGAVINYSSNPANFMPEVLTIWEGTELFNFCPLVYAYQVVDIAITGKGTLNGNAGKYFATLRSQRSEQQNKLRQMGIDQTPVYERHFGVASKLPPSMVQPYGCKNILIEGITILDAPYWVIHPVFCDNVTVRGVTISSKNLNNDGCDPESTTNVLIENCTFNCGDDAIAIKAGRDQDAWRIGQPTENVVIRNCLFNSKCNGLCIGSEMAGGVRNVYMENVKIKNCLSAIYFKSNLDRGGFIENVWVRNVETDSVRSAYIRFDADYPGGRGGNTPTRYNNFNIENVTCKRSGECGIYAVGIESLPMRNVTMRNVIIDYAPMPYQFKFIENFKFENVKINGVTLPASPEQVKAVTRLKSW